MRLLALSGFIPEQICDIVRFTGYEGERNISHYCGYVADYITQVLQDPQIDGAVFPRTCDSSRVIASYLSDSGKFRYQLHIPGRQDELAAGILRDSLIAYQRAVEEHYGVTLSDISERIRMVNERNRALRKLYEDIQDISFASYLSGIHRMLQKPLREQNAEDMARGLSERKGSGKRIYLIGSFLADVEVVLAIEAVGLRIVGDRLAESKRLFSAPAVQEEGDVYENIARSILRTPLSPSQNDFGAILAEDREELMQKQVEGVIFVTQKFCEPYDYLYSVYRGMLEEMGIPALRLVLADRVNRGKTETLLEAFADTL